MVKMQLPDELEYEKCDRIDLAIDISQNLHCYDFIPGEKSIVEYGHKAAIEDYLIKQGTVSEECFDFESYGRKKIQDAGMVLTSSGYIKRNENDFSYEDSQPDGIRLSMQTV